MLHNAGANTLRKATKFRNIFSIDALPVKITCKPNQTAGFITTPTTAAVTADNVVVKASELEVLQQA